MKSYFDKGYYMLKICKSIRVLAAIAVISFCMAGLCGCMEPKPLDYSDSNNWSVFDYTAPSEEGAADIFYVGSDCVNPESCDFYIEGARFYEPKFRVGAISPEESKSDDDWSYLDMKQAFSYYLDTLNEGRPFVLAGSAAETGLLKKLVCAYEYDKRLSGNLVAVYAYGFEMTDYEHIRYPKVYMAEGECDTGVVVNVTKEEPTEDAPEDGLLPLSGYSEDVSRRTKQFLTLRTLASGDFAKGQEGAKLASLALSDDAKQPIEGMYLAPGVYEDMCNAEHWLRYRDNADEVIMDAAGIEEFNNSLKGKNPNPQHYVNYVGEDCRTELSAQELTELLEIFKFDNMAERFRAADGSALEQEYCDKLLELRNIANVKPVNTVKYGVMLESASVRMLPTADVFTTEEEYDYCDSMQNSSVRMNEPVIVLMKSGDGRWLFVITPYCLGWVDVHSVGVTEDYDFWSRSIDPKDFLIVTDNHARLDEDPSNAAVSRRCLDMGTKLALTTDGSFTENDYHRHAFHNYCIKLPCRTGNGELYYKNTYLPQNIDVHRGYLEYTQRNVLELAFKALGEQYGWGGLYGNRDCSQYVMELYRCFGFSMPRNTASMLGIPWSSLNVAGMSEERKGEVFDLLPAGSLLIFPGHVMMYLGKENGEYYCISATGSMKTDVNADGTIRARSVLVNSLNSTWRGSGISWMNSITSVKVPYRK